MIADDTKRGILDFCPEAGGFTDVKECVHEEVM